MSAGKGDRYRPVDQKKYDEGWEAAFGKNSKKKTSKKKKDKYVNIKKKTQDVAPVGEFAPVLPPDNHHGSR